MWVFVGAGHSLCTNFGAIGGSCCRQESPSRLKADLGIVVPEVRNGEYVQQIEASLNLKASGNYFFLDDDDGDDDE